jgi:2-methylcitrate dehydratase PrpD
MLPATTQPPREITREIAAFAVNSRLAALPDHVQAEAARAFLNWMGCVLGGCGEPAVEIAIEATMEVGGGPQASIIGQRRRTDIASAAFLNCLSSSVLAFDDTHLATVTHPTGPVAASLFALCERETVSGEEFLNALALGIEIQCRMSNVLLLPPSQSNLGFYVTGLTGPIGTAAAVGRLLKFDERQVRWAIGLAAAQSAGFRATHGTMAGAFVPAHAARSGLSGALLAAKGFTCSDRILEGGKGFVDVFSSAADLGRAVDGLGRHFELLANAYKPYPCGIVIHPAIDASLEIAVQIEPGVEFEKVSVKVDPLALTLTNRRQPTSSWEAQVSLYHWVAAALLRRSAGLAEIRQDVIADAGISALRARIEAIADPTLGRDGADVAVTLSNGAVLRSHVAHARGSVARPMTDDELETKFLAQASLVLPDQNSRRLLALCREVATLRDVGKEISALWRD